MRRVEAATPADEAPAATIRAMAEMVRELSDSATPRSIGVGSPGLVDHKTGIVRTSPNLPKWRNVPLKSELERATGLPVTVANDVNAMAWGEFKIGSGRGCRNLLCITMGTGLGGGIILNGDLYTGKDDTAGEIGHVAIVPGGHPCPCGNRGCLEQYVAKAGIIRRASEAGADLGEVTPKTVADAAGEGKEWARKVFDGVAMDLGFVLAGMIQVLNLDKIVVGGKISEAGEVLFGPLRTHTNAQVYPFLRDKYAIEVAELGANGGIIGAALLDY